MLLPIVNSGLSLHASEDRNKGGGDCSDTGGLQLMYQSEGRDYSLSDFQFDDRCVPFPIVDKSVPAFNNIWMLQFV